MHCIRTFYSAWQDFTFIVHELWSTIYFLNNLADQFFAWHSFMREIKNMFNFNIFWWKCSMLIWLLDCSLQTERSIYCQKTNYKNLRNSIYCSVHHYSFKIVSFKIKQESSTCNRRLLLTAWGMNLTEENQRPSKRSLGNTAVNLSFPKIVPT